MATGRISSLPSRIANKFKSGAGSQTINFTAESQNTYLVILRGTSANVDVTSAYVIAGGSASAVIYPLVGSTNVTTSVSGFDVTFSSSYLMYFYALNLTPIS